MLCHFCMSCCAPILTAYHSRSSAQPVASVPQSDSSPSPPTAWYSEGCLGPQDAAKLERVVPGYEATLSPAFERQRMTRHSDEAKYREEVHGAFMRLTKDSNQHQYEKEPTYSRIMHLNPHALRLSSGKLRADGAVLQMMVRVTSCRHVSARELLAIPRNNATIPPCSTR